MSAIATVKGWLGVKPQVQLPVDPEREQVTLADMKDLVESTKAGRYEYSHLSKDQVQRMNKDVSGPRHDMLNRVLAQTPGNMEAYDERDGALRTALSLATGNVEGKSANALCLEGVQNLVAGQDEHGLDSFLQALAKGPVLTVHETRALSLEGLKGAAKAADQYRNPSYMTNFVQVLAKQAGDERLKAAAAPALEVGSIYSTGSSRVAACHAVLRVGMQAIPSNLTTLQVVERTMHEASFRTVDLQEFALTMKPFLKVIQKLRPLTTEETGIATAKADSTDQKTAALKYQKATHTDKTFESIVARHKAAEKHIAHAALVKEMAQEAKEQAEYQAYAAAHPEAPSSGGNSYYYSSPAPQRSSGGGFLEAAGEVAAGYVVGNIATNVLEHLL